MKLADSTISVSRVDIEDLIEIKDLKKNIKKIYERLGMAPKEASKDAVTKINIFLARSILTSNLYTDITEILGFTELLKNKKIATDEMKREKYLKIIYDRTKLLYKKVDYVVDLLTFGHIEMKKSEIKKIIKFKLEDALMLMDKINLLDFFRTEGILGRRFKVPK